MSHLEFILIGALWAGGVNLIAFAAMRRAAHRTGTTWMAAALTPDWRGERLGPFRAGTIWWLWFLSGIAAFFAVFLAGA